MKKEINTLIISGGGLRAIIYGGVFKYLYELNEKGKINLNISKIACVSAGSFFALLYILGYNPAEIEDELLNKKFSHLKSVNIGDFFDKFGLDSGKNLISWLETLMIKKNVPKEITFKELFNKSNIHLEIYATNLSKFKLVKFDHITYPDISVLKAIRMTMSLPLVFTAEKFENDIYVDGAIINNYPIDLLNNSDLDTTLGICLSADADNNCVSIDNMIEFVSNFINCTIIYRDQLKFKHYYDHTIFLNDFKNDSVNFNLSSSHKKKMFLYGYKTTEKYFKFILEKKNDEN